MVSLILVVFRSLLWGWRAAPPIREIVNFVLQTHNFRRFRKRQNRLSGITSDDVYKSVTSAEPHKGLGTCIVVNNDVESGKKDEPDDLMIKMVVEKLIEEEFCNNIVPDSITDYDSNLYYYRVELDIRKLADRGIEVFRREYPKEVRKRCSWYNLIVNGIIEANNEVINKMNTDN